MRPRKRKRSADGDETVISSPSPGRASPLAQVHTFTIPASLAEATLDVVADAGSQGAEAFVLWGGTVKGNGLKFRSMIVPDQVAHRTERGLLVTVEGTALFEANKELYQRREILAAQVHSHPTQAFHSDTDDCYSLVTLSGAVSIVIPDFGRRRLDAIGDWAIYRLIEASRWAPLTENDRVQIVIDEPGD